jgi:hypothetical protein
VCVCHLRAAQAVAGLASGFRAGLNYSRPGRSRNVRIKHPGKGHRPRSSRPCGRSRAAPRSAPSTPREAVCTGRFQASLGSAAGYAGAPHLQGQSVPEHHRFSNSAGNLPSTMEFPTRDRCRLKFRCQAQGCRHSHANSIEGSSRGRRGVLGSSGSAPGPVTGRPVADAVQVSKASPGAAAFVGRLHAEAGPASYPSRVITPEHAFRFTEADGTSRFGVTTSCPSERGLSIAR